MQGFPSLRICKEKLFRDGDMGDHSETIKVKRKEEVSLIIHIGWPADRKYWKEDIIDKITKSNGLAVRSLAERKSRLAK
jgi:hypothetical protein